MKKLIGISCISFLVWTFTATVAQAVRWLYIGESEGFVFYIDMDKEAVNGSYWTAPIRAETDDTTFLGQVLIDCSRNTYKIQLGNQIFDWESIGEGSPLSSVTERVCR